MNNKLSIKIESDCGINPLDLADSIKYMLRDVYEVENVAIEGRCLCSCPDYNPNDVDVEIHVNENWGE